MNNKRFTMIAMVLAVMALFAGMVVSAQDEDTTTMGKRGGPRFGFGSQSEVILEATGLTSDELWQALQEGSTVAELIEANDGDVESVISALVEEATTHINEHVEEGRLTQARADVILESLEENITNRLNDIFERPAGFGDRFERGRRGHRGRGFGFGPNSSDDTTPDESTTEGTTETPEDA